MPSKKSKTTKTAPHLWKAAPTCSEPELKAIIKQWCLTALRAPAWVLFEGPLGAGKSTSVRWCLETLGVRETPEGSPTFPIVHEYTSQVYSCSIDHVDFYRLRSEEEIVDAGIDSVFWEKNGIVFAEWSSLFPEFRETLLERAPSNQQLWLIELAYAENPELRALQISFLGS